jgi:hypothetical protein
VRHRAFFEGNNRRHLEGRLRSQGLISYNRPAMLSTGKKESGGAFRHRRSLSLKPKLRACSRRY